MLNKLSIYMMSVVLLASCCPKSETADRSDEAQLLFQKATDLFECEVRFSEKYTDSLPDISKYLEILDSAIALNPRDREMKMTKAFWYGLKKDYKSQGEIYLDIYQTHKEKANSMLFEVAVCKDNLGDRDSADYYYRKYIEETKNRSKKIGGIKLSEALDIATARYLLTDDQDNAKEMFYTLVDSTKFSNTDKYYDYYIARWVNHSELYFPDGRAKRNTN